MELEHQQQHYSFGRIDYRKTYNPIITNARFRIAGRPARDMQTDRSMRSANGRFDMY